MAMRRSCIIWIILCACHTKYLLVTGRRPQEIPLKIVGVFDKSSSHLHSVFERGISAANDLQDRFELRGFQLNTTSFNVVKNPEKLCTLLEQGVLAVINMQEMDSNNYVHSVCDFLEIPNIDLRWSAASRTAFSINLFPDPVTFSTALHALIRFYEWMSFTILYETDDELMKFQDVLKEGRYVVTLRKLQGPNYLTVLKELRTSGEQRIILESPASSVPEILKQAQQMKLLTPAHHYFLTSLDTHTINLSTFVYDQTKITSFRLIDPKAVNMQNVATKQSHPDPVATITTEEALLFDAVMLLSKAFESADLLPAPPFSVDCESGSSWRQGTGVFNAISYTAIEGTTGPVSFDSRGARSGFHLDIMQATESRLETVGFWSLKDGVKLGSSPSIQSSVDPIKGKVLNAITVLEDPYVMLKKDHESRTGNDRYEGYCVDMMNLIAEDLKFNYTLKNKDGMTHGVYNPDTNEWDGLIRELIEKRGDVAVGGITISHSREQVVDFTKPFMHLGISILYRKPEKQPPDLFSFLHPFKTNVWFFIITALVAVSVTIFVLGRFSPYEWYNPHPCNEHADTVENQFTISNSFWFTVGSLMQQGSDVSPRAVSTRTIAGCWWFFTLIMIASYTANLASFLAVEKTDQPIKTADDLAKQTTVKYGSYKGGATYNFFKGSKHPVYQKMWLFMNQDSRNNFVNSTADGIKFVKEKKYAYLMESPSLEYNVNQHCELMQIGGLLDSKGFGLATQQNSPYRDEISKSILKFQENSELEVLKVKWWKGKSSVICETSNPQDAMSELGLANVGGVFIILLGGVAVSLLVMILEFIWGVRKSAKLTKRPFCFEFSSTFVEALRPKQSADYTSCLM